VLPKALHMLPPRRTYDNLRSRGLTSLQQQYTIKFFVLRTLNNYVILCNSIFMLFYYCIIV